MKKSRIRITAPVVATRADAERILGEIAALTAERNGAIAELDQRLTSIRSEYEGGIDDLKTQIEHRTGLLQQWADASPEEFAGKKSIDFLHGRLGFRTGNPSLKTLAGWTFKKALELLDDAFVRVKRDVDREGLLAAYAKHEIGDSELRAVGLKVVQEEAFFVEPKVAEEAA